MKQYADKKLNINANCVKKTQPTIKSTFDSITPTQSIISRDEALNILSSLHQDHNVSKNNNETLLPTSLMQKMEHSFNTNFSNVSLHVGNQAPSIGALAYTRGNDIYFGQDQFRPESIEGQKMIGHELAHVMQQRKGKISPTSQKNGLQINEDSALEAEADKYGEMAAYGKQINSTLYNVMSVQSQDIVQGMFAFGKEKKEKKKEKEKEKEEKARQNPLIIVSNELEDILEPENSNVSNPAHHPTEAKRFAKKKDIPETNIVKSNLKQKSDKFNREHNGVVHLFFHGAFNKDEETVIVIHSGDSKKYVTPQELFNLLKDRGLFKRRLDKIVFNACLSAVPTKHKDENSPSGFRFNQSFAERFYEILLNDEENYEWAHTIVIKAADGLVMYDISGKRKRTVEDKYEGKTLGTWTYLNRPDKIRMRKKPLLDLTFPKPDNWENNQPNIVPDDIVQQGIEHNSVIIVNGILYRVYDLQDKDKATFIAEPLSASPSNQRNKYITNSQASRQYPILSTSLYPTFTIFDNETWGNNDDSLLHDNIIKINGKWDDNKPNIIPDEICDQIKPDKHYRSIIVVNGIQYRVLKVRDNRELITNEKVPEDAYMVQPLSSSSSPTQANNDQTNVRRYPTFTIFDTETSIISDDETSDNIDNSLSEGDIIKINRKWEDNRPNILPDQIIGRGVSHGDIIMINGIQYRVIEDKKRTLPITDNNKQGKFLYVIPRLLGG